jgi:ParB-like chromosome segregation protein Spo0J
MDIMQKSAINDIVEKAQHYFAAIEWLDLDAKVKVINDLKILLHEMSPFSAEPVDCVLWVPAERVHANDYNPNAVAPPEMELLKISIQEDGYTQPIVTFPEGDSREVVDGFHRNRVGKECKEIYNRIHGYLPVVSINVDRTDKADRIASTIRHNRARGKHTIDAMSEIIIELKNRNWTNARIARELGMDEDEILRLCQITGLADLFKDDDFSKSWLIEDSELEYDELTDGMSEEEKEANGFKTINTSDENRVFHTFDKWECFAAGFYETAPPKGMTKTQCEEEYAKFLSDDKLFRKTLKKVTTEWVHSCEHYLTNDSMNRIAWLGQASLCYAKKIPAAFRGGFHLLTEEDQLRANTTALEFLNKWLTLHKMKELTLDEALALGRQVDIY